MYRRIIRRSVYIISVITLVLTVACRNKKQQGLRNQSGASSNPTKKQAMTKKTTQTFTAQLSGSNGATGMLTVRLRGDSVHVKGQFSGLSSQYSSSHIYKGAKAKKGTAVQSLNPSRNSNAKAGSWGGSYYWNSNQISALKAGKLYVVVASQNHPKGEIRGQLKPSKRGKNKY